MLRIPNSQQLTRFMPPVDHLSKFLVNSSMIKYSGLVLEGLEFFQPNDLINQYMKRSEQGGKTIIQTSYNVSKS